MRSPEEIKDAMRFLVALAYFALFFLFGTNLFALLFYGHVVRDYGAYQKKTFIVQETARARAAKERDLVKGRIDGRELEVTYDGKNLFQVTDFTLIKPGDTCDVYLNTAGAKFGYNERNIFLISVEDYVHAQARLIKHLIGVLATMLITFLIWKKNPWFHPFRAAAKPTASSGK